MPRLSWKSWVVIGVIVLAAILAWNRWRPYSIVNASPSGTNVIALGDSLTAGVGAAEVEGFVDVLSVRLGRPILNKGVPGDTTGDALQRLERDVLRQDPRIVLLLLGGNDQLRQMSTDPMIGNLREIIERIQDQGALVVLIGLGATPLNPTLGERYRSLAREMGCPFVPDVLEGVFGNRSLMSDQVHPNAAGYTRMADRIEPVLRKYMK